MNTPTVTPTTDKPQTRLAQLKQLVSVLFDTLPPMESTNLMERVQRIAEATEYREASLERQLESLLKDYGVFI
jgi:hypothetical protein